MSDEGEFEFSNTQENTIGSLAGKMRFVGTLLLIVGVLSVLGGIFVLLSQAPGGIGGLIQGGTYTVIGLWTRNAADSFRQIVDTQGSDVSNLMQALGQLLRLYTLQYWLIMILVVIAGAGLIAALLGTLFVS